MEPGGTVEMDVAPEGLLQSTSSVSAVSGDDQDPPNFDNSGPPSHLTSQHLALDDEQLTPGEEADLLKAIDSYAPTVRMIW
jgi:hypothetical protein